MSYADDEAFIAANAEPDDYEYWTLDELKVMLDPQAAKEHVDQAMASRMARWRRRVEAEST